MRLLLPTLVLSAVAASPAATASARPYDFDGDRRQELVAGVPGWSVKGAPNAGAIFVFRGTRAGAAVPPRLLTSDSPAVPGVSQGDDHLGGSVASGDFDGDGYADLAAAARGEGRVVVLRGSRGGLTTRRARMLRHAGPLAAADLNGDGFADLVMGAPTHSPVRNDDYGSGAVRIFLGGARGLRRQAARILTRPGRLDHEFGAVLAVADVNGDGHPDIVEGAPGSTENLDEGGIPGHLSYCAGTRSGPARCRSIAPSLPGGPTSLALGDVTCDGRPDIVAGVPSNRFVEEDDPEPPGAVLVWKGRAAGPARRRTVITQRRLGLPRPSQPAEFGRAVAVARVNGDGCADIVAGAPRQDHSAGRVVIVHGSRRGLGASAGRVLVQGESGVPGASAARHRFGAALCALDMNGDGRADLAIGAPGERTVSTLTGARRGLADRDGRRLALDEFGIPVPVDPPRMSGSFGGVLGAPGS